MLKRRFLVLQTAWILAAATASATTTYSSQSSLESSNPDLTFTAIDLTAFIGQSLLSSITVGGVTFSGAGSTTFSVPNATTLTMDVGGTLNVTLPANARAFGSNIANIGSTTLTISFTGDGTPYSDGPNVVPSTIFFGARVTTSFTTSIGYTTGLGKISLSNFEIGTMTAEESPEGRTMLLLGTGLVALRFLRRFRATASLRATSSPEAAAFPSDRPRFRQT
jgi:hypothetical protein